MKIWKLFAIVASILAGVSTAQATTMVSYGTTGAGSEIDLTFDGYHDIWTFELLDPLPEGVKLNLLSGPNQSFVYSRETGELLDYDNLARENLRRKYTKITDTSFTVHLWFVNNKTQQNIVWWNAAWFPLDYQGEDNISLNYKLTQVSLAAPVPEPATWLTMIAGFGLVGAALRRRKPVAMFS